MQGHQHVMQPATIKHRRWMNFQLLKPAICLARVLDAPTPIHGDKKGQEPTIPGIGEAVAEAGGPRDPRSLDLGLKWSLGGFLGEGWLWGAHRNTCSCPGSIEGWRSWLRRRSGHEPPVIIWGVHGGSEELWSSDASACKGRWKRKSREQWGPRIEEEISLRASHNVVD